MKYEDLFNKYQRTLEWIERRRKPDTLEFYEETAEAWAHAKEVAFTMFEDLRLYFETPSLRTCMDRERASEFPPYKPEGSDNAFPCIGVLKYREREYPVYNDDYGMSYFIVVNGYPLQVDSFGGETDWYYELDRIIDEI